jgi:hypothetical protein
MARYFVATQRKITSPQSEVVVTENWIMSEHPLTWLARRGPVRSTDPLRHTIIHILFWQEIPDDLALPDSMTDW